ncbi:hypothetical protein MMC18_003445 [Xylographa bjoerkii]|nr:hypothetical protein [Xylographa bjoerkii]
MAANALASSGTKRTADHFGNARRNLHTFGRGGEWALRCKMYGVPVSPIVNSDNGDETVGKIIDKARRKMCNRLWGTAMTRFVSSTFSRDFDDQGMQFRNPVAVGSTSIIAVASGQFPTKLAKALLVLQQGHLESSDDDTPPAAAPPLPRLLDVRTLTSQPSPPQFTITAQQAAADLQQCGTWNMKELQRRGKQLGMDGKGTAEYQRIIAQLTTTGVGSGTTGAGSIATGGGTGATGAGSSATGGGAATTDESANTIGGAADVPVNPNTVEDELLWARKAIAALRKRINTSGWREIVHRDICPSNVLLCNPDPESPWDFYPIPKLADFGDAIETGPDDNKNPENYQYETTEGLHWAPAEATAVSGIRFSAQSNVYQLGLTMAHATYLDPHSVHNARIGNLTADVPYRTILIKTIESCLHTDPEERITPLALYKLTRTCLADCTQYLTEQAPDRFRIYEPTVKRTQEMATGFYRPTPEPVALVDVQFPLADVEPSARGIYLRPPTIDRFYPYEDDNLDFFVNSDNGFLQRQQQADEVLPQDVISIADRGEHYFNKMTDPDFLATTFDASD